MENGVVNGLWLASHIHQQAAALCLNPAPVKPGLTRSLLHFVAFELGLLSIEQGLKLSIYVSTGKMPPGERHNVSSLFKKAKKETSVIPAAIAETNATLEELGIPTTTTSKVGEVLQQHKNSYTSFRYFGISPSGERREAVSMAISESQVVHCFAQSLNNVVEREIEMRNIAAPRPRQIPESEITAEDREIFDRMRTRYPFGKP